MCKKVLAIKGSQHVNGATTRMLDLAVEEAKNKGVEVDYVDLQKMNIGFCLGCRKCLDTKKCVTNDDIHILAQKLKECDLVILAAPTYWANVPAMVKNMFDRLLGVVMEETIAFPKPLLSSKQKYILLTACQTQSPFDKIFGQSSHSIAAMKEFFKTAGMTYAGKCVWAGGKKDVMPKKCRKKINKLINKCL